MNVWLEGGPFVETDLLLQNKGELSLFFSFHSTDLNNVQMAVENATGNLHFKFQRNLVTGRNQFAMH